MGFPGLFSSFSEEVAEIILPSVGSVCSIEFSVSSGPFEAARVLSQSDVETRE